MARPTWRVIGRGHGRRDGPGLLVRGHERLRACQPLAREPSAAGGALFGANAFMCV